MQIRNLQKIFKYPLFFMIKYLLKKYKIEIDIAGRKVIFKTMPEKRHCRIFHF